MIRMKNSLNPGLYRIMMLIGTDVLHIFAENRPAEQQNYVMLNEVN